ncbi:diversity-generating retroelement protein Avd [Candidatus Saccharibacteria bacterium]|jgi:four helix bundle protein|nr:diversity-generating retroelement protein Avd [Candidatus Saccharibacteria bacterium]
MKQDFIIYTKMLEVVLWTFEKVNTFPKKQRFILGQQIENSSLAALRLIIEANNVRDDQVALKRLEGLNVELEVMRSLFRVAFEVSFIKASSLGYITEKIDEVGRMGGSWQKKVRVRAASRE